MASEPQPGQAPPPAPSADRGGLFLNLGRGAKGVALLLFLLPWITVSCAGTEIASMSGYDLATGSVSVRNPMTGQAASPPGDGRPGDLWVMAAAGAILAGLVVTFVLPRAIAALLAAVAAVGAAGMIGYTVLIRLPAELREQSPSLPGGPGAAGGGGAADLGLNAQQMADMIRVEPAAAFWLTLAALIAAAVLNALARSRAGP